jgi:hypothetical protein
MMSARRNENGSGWAKVDLAIVCQKPPALVQTQGELKNIMVMP